MTDDERTALDQRLAGGTYPNIARAMELPDADAAQALVASALSGLTLEDAEEYRRLEMLRLDRMFLGLWPTARGGERGAVDRCLEIVRLRAVLMEQAPPQQVADGLDEIGKARAKRLAGIAAAAH